MLTHAINLFKRRNTTIDVVERTNRELTMKRDFHQSRVAALDAQIAELIELKRQHGVACDAINDALISLGVSDVLQVPHIQLASDIQHDIKAARSLTDLREAFIGSSAWMQARSLLCAISFNGASSQPAPPLQRET